MSNENWKRCFQINFSNLVRDINSRAGLYEELRKHEVFVEQTLKQIWEIPDDSELKAAILDAICKGDDTRFRKFRQALLDNGQHRIVAVYLDKHAASADWKRCIQANFSNLLTAINTQSGLYGDMLKRNVFVEMTLKRIWEIPDDSELITTMLNTICQGDDTRLMNFRQALLDNGQLNVVAEYLDKCPEPKDYSDATVHSATARRDVPLSQTAKNCLTRGWNDIASRMILDEGILNAIESQGILEKTQVKILRDTGHEFKRNEKAMRFLERRCQRHYDMFYQLLYKSGQGAVLYYMAGPSDARPCATGEQPTREAAGQQTGSTTAGAKSGFAPAAVESVPLSQPQQPVQETSPCQQTSTFAGGPSFASEQDLAAMKSLDINIRLSQTSADDVAATAVKSVVEPTGIVINRVPYVCGGKTYFFQAPSHAMLNWMHENIQKDDVYNVRYAQGLKRARGCVLIIANTIFQNSEQNREGTVVDLENLQKVFEYLNFDIYVRQNLTAEGIRSACSEFKQQLTGEETVFALFILSHGLRDCVQGTDGGRVSIDVIMTMFDGRNCEKLRGKPRLFLIQACQGDRTTRGIATDQADADSGFEDKSDTPPTSNEKADEVVVTAAYPGYVAWRNSTYGSYFVQFLVDVLFLNAHEEDFLSMMTKVTKRLNQHVMNECNKQICRTTYTLTKKVYLFPY